MKITWRELWTAGGMVDRETYALVGVLGFALKHNLDRMVATLIFHRPWGPFNYWVPLGEVARITALRNADAIFLETMVLLSLPFVWVGVALTMKRLRSVQLPSGLVVLFFVPFLNLLFFLFLCLVPARSSDTADQASRLPRESFIYRMVPDSAIGSAAISLLITVPLGFGMALLGAQFLMIYGWGLFVGLPFAMGFAAALIYGVRQPRSIGGCVGVACLSVTLLGAAFLGLAIEGVFCLLMAMPIALALAVIGGCFGYLVQRKRWLHEAPAFLSVLLVLAPGIQWIEHAAAPTAPVYAVRSSIDIQASPERVWKRVVAFAEIPPPREWMFRAGIAYPIRAEIFGTGPGAERHCGFSTGAFVEPIEVWDEPRRLKFSVTSNPAPMEEWTPYSHIEPAHLHGFLVSNGGQFLLTPLPNGGTRLEGTTWYRHSLWPAAYWRIWSDEIIHQIHLRVLRHIRDEVEGTTQPGV
jgi:hypothetical protein